MVGSRDIAGVAQAVVSAVAPYCVSLHPWRGFCEAKVCGAMTSDNLSPIRVGNAMRALQIIFVRRGNEHLLILNSENNF